MSSKRLALSIVKRYPELQDIAPKHLKIVKRAIEDAIISSSRNLVSLRETRDFIKTLVPDAGTPAAALRGYRGREELTQRELARKCGIPQSHIAAMESGKRPIGLISAKKLALVLNIDYRRLV